MKISKTKAVKAILKETFPDYTGRKFYLDNSGKVSFTNTNWCEGSRNAYKAINLENGKVQQLSVPAPWANTVEGSTVEIPEGFAVVCWAHFMGLQAVTIYTKESSVALLPMLAA